MVGLATMAIKGKDLKYAIPFGPFLCMAAVAYLFFGGDLIALFLSLRI